MKFSPEALLDLADMFEIILDFDKEGICFYVQNGHLPGLDDVIALISKHQDEIKSAWLKRDPGENAT